MSVDVVNALKLLATVVFFMVWEMAFQQQGFIYFY